MEKQKLKKQVTGTGHEENERTAKRRPNFERSESPEGEGLAKFLLNEADEYLFTELRPFSGAV